MFTRRQFLRGAITVSAAAFVAQLTGCAPAGSPTPTAVPPTITPEPPEPTAATAPAPTASSTPATRAATALPTKAQPTPVAAAPTAPVGTYLAVARGDDPAELARRAVRALGGMERFVQKGQSVLVKPNICVAYHGPEYAATTNPQVVAAIVQMCREAGASSVTVMDYPFGGSADQAYKISQIGDAVRAAGGQMVTMTALKFKETDIPAGKDIHKWPVYQDALKADVLIDVPIAKHHNLARLTLAHKNLMGLIQNRESIHSGIGERLADLATLFKPRLTIVDAYRMLMANGPTGGSLSDVKLQKTLIASADIVAADAYAATLFGLKPESISYIAASAARGTGTLDLKSIKIEEIAA
ncbi:MAG: DUF362 domain-containing protein [Chloroflexi bacterium]|nr:DUF362 domain-containing protein [Chloroflexota bacterium]